MVQDSWYALSVKSRWESVVAANLRSKGYEPFVPTYKVSRRWSDRVKTLDMPLISGYRFCPVDLRARLPILITPGVKVTLGSGKTPEPCSYSQIEASRAVVQCG